VKLVACERSREGLPSGGRIPLPLFISELVLWR